MDRTKTDTEIKALREQSIAAIEPHLATLNAVELQELLDAENGQEAPRTTLVALIEKEQLARLEDEEPAPETPKGESGKGVARSAEGSAEAPAFLAEDYTGPLTIDQAERRREKFGQHTVKPTAAPKTK